MRVVIFSAFFTILQEDQSDFIKLRGQVISESKKWSPRVAQSTVRTISDAAGVSVSTVSRALKSDPRISEATRTRIIAIAKQQEYTPNAFARGLVTRSSGVVGIVLGNLSNPFYTEMVECLTKHLVAMGKAPMILHIGGRSLDSEDIRPLVSYQMDGCIIASAPLSSTAADECAQRRLPMVMVNRVARTHSCAVSCNNRGGGQMIGELLIEAGHKHIAFIAGREDTSTSEDREAGFRAALSEAGMKLSDWARGHYTYEGGFAAAEKLLSSRNRPDAIFAANDVMGLGVIDAARKLGIDIPGELSVIGFDDIRMSSWMSYQLTTIAQPLEAMVERSLELLRARMENRDMPGEEVFVEGELRVRATARLPKRLVGAGE